MAPGVCVTSFRMLMRRTDLGQFSRGLRLTPVATLTTVNSWNLRRRGYCTEKPYEPYLEEISTGKTNIEKASAQSKQGTQTTALGIENDSSAKFARKKLSHSQKENNVKDKELSVWKVAQLKAELRAQKLSTKGKKEILIERLQHNGWPNGKEAPECMLSADVKPPTEAIATLPPPQALLQTPLATLATNSSTVTSNCGAPKTGDIYVAADINHSRVKDEFVAYNEQHGEVSVEYIQGLPHLTIPLPSRNEKCRFALKPVSHKVGDLIDMLKAEDRGIDRALVLNSAGVRIASTCNIESLMDESFWLHINDQKYKVVPPTRERLGAEDLNKLGDIRSLVAQLYEALHVGEYHLQKEEELTKQLEDLKYQVKPLESQKSELSMQAERKTNMMTWVGLGLMSVQFGVLARLTWWEYSWDIMEPVTYFVTYGTAMAVYAYYCITKTEYNLPEVKDRNYLLHIHKRAKKKNFDIETYNTLKRQIAELEYDLRRLRDPLNLQLPPHIDRSQEGTPAAPAAQSTIEALTNTITGSKKKAGFKLPFLEPKK